MLYFNLKNRKLKGNISILVILVLLACSLMGILSMNFLNNLVSYTDDSYTYYKSYYIGKAGLELALTEINNSDAGFSQEIFSGDVINENNFNCDNCGFNLFIRGRSAFISNNFWQNVSCDEENALSIPAKGSLIIPMFYDNTSDFGKIFSDHTYINLYNYRKNLKIEKFDNSEQKMNIGAIIQSGGGIDWKYMYMTGMNFSQSFFINYFEVYDRMYQTTSFDNPDIFAYLVISNPNSDEVKFCINARNDDFQKELAWPTTKYYISSRGEYKDKTVGLQAIYTQPIPSFLINPYVSTEIDNLVSQQVEYK